MRNPDGNVSHWKPGSNYSFSLASVAPLVLSKAARFGAAAAAALGAVAVRDAWDGAARDVSVDVVEARGGMSEEEMLEQDAYRTSVRGQHAALRVRDCVCVCVRVYARVHLVRISASMRQLATPIVLPATPLLPAQLHAALQELSQHISDAEEMSSSIDGEAPGARARAQNRAPRRPLRSARGGTRLLEAHSCSLCVGPVCSQRLAAEKRPSFLLPCDPQTPRPRTCWRRTG